jgi:hypothetical protein
MNSHTQLGIWEATPKNIPTYKQDHPELVVEDVRNELSKYADFDWIRGKDVIIKRMCDLVRQSMLIRGINKWLKVRRDLISYNRSIKELISNEHEVVTLYKYMMHKSFIPFKDKPTPTEILLHFRYREEYIIAKTKIKVLATIHKDLKRMILTNRWQNWQGKSLKEMNSNNSLAVTHEFSHACQSECTGADSTVLCT